MLGARLEKSGGDAPEEHDALEEFVKPLWYVTHTHIHQRITRLDCTTCTPSATLWPHGSIAQWMLPRMGDKCPKHSAPLALWTTWEAFEASDDTSHKYHFRPQGSHRMLPHSVLVSCMALMCWVKGCSIT